MKSIERFRSELANNVKMVGGSITMNDIIATELLTRHLDFVWIDMEHGGLSIDAVEGHILVAKKNGKIALVRVPELNMAYIKMVLDAGAHGVIVPQIYTADEVREAVRFTRYYPEGKRGFGPRMPYVYGQMGSPRDYLEWANKNIFLAIQIETKESYENLDEILSVEGFDSICIGPADFSLAHGFWADIKHTEVKKMLKDVILKTRAAGKHIGFGMGIDFEYAAAMMDMGVDWIQVGSDFDYINKLSGDLYFSLKK
jgi:2-keto-3-deoxy-L-rhamnonate aldolase RhmA